ncbi:MAG TPA: ArgE/DapE family deacylase [Candidatus Limnocylindrales bacterium]|nr:ArgE/DapE family deacylase [Candidatus Limnocylindrales bacterium]
MPDSTAAPRLMATGLSDAARAAADAVDPAAIRDELAAIVRIPSVTGREEAVAGELAGRAREAGLAVELLTPDPAAIRADSAWPGEETERTSLPVVIGRIGRPGGRRLVLSGHIDVVPPGDPATWMVDPWGGEVRDGRLHGRGACDMKGGVAAILGAVRALVASGAAARLAGELVVALVPGEEDGGQGTLAAIRAGVRGDLAIITEPSNLEIVVAHAGAITFRLTVPGRAAHASQRREGVSALDNLYVVLRALEADETARNASETDPLMTVLGLPYPTIVGIVAGGEWASTVLDRVVVHGRYGVRLGQSPANAAADLRRAIDAANESDPFLSEHPATVEIVGGTFGSGRIPSEHPLPVGLADAAEAVTGRRPALLGEPYGADMRLFINEGDTPCVMYGPGDVKVAHGADEHVSLAEVEECARVLAAWVVRELGVG